MRQRDGSTRRRDHEDGAGSAEDIGRQLRDAREARGLDLLAVHDRLSRPITQLEALENGNLASLPDQALALSTLRRYAAFLGLDGDALALRMIDDWPAASPGGAVTDMVTGVTAAPNHLRAFTQTGQVPRVGGVSTAAVGGFGLAVATGPPTGTFPVVPRQDIRNSKRAVARARRRLRAPRPLRVMTWLSALLLVAVAVGFGIYRWRTQWLASAHILRVVGPAPSGGATHRTALAPARAAPPASPVVLSSSTTQASSYTVTGHRVTVAIVTSAKCWVQVTDSSSATPLVEGVQPAGKQLAFPVAGTVTVQVGASAVVVGLSVQGRAVFLDTPKYTPYTYTFTNGAG